MSRRLFNPRLMKEVVRARRRLRKKLDPSKMSQYGINRYRIMQNKGVVIIRLGRKKKLAEQEVTGD